MVTLPFTDSNLNLQNKAGTIIVDATQFYLSFGNAFIKLISCGLSDYGLCASTETDPESVITKYSPNDQFLMGDAFVSCPSGWSGLNGRCFKYFDGPLSQANAELDCKTRNATLANANSNEKFSLLQSIVSTDGAFVSIQHKNKFFFD